MKPVEPGRMASQSGIHAGYFHGCGRQQAERALRFAEQIAEFQRRQVDIEPGHFAEQVVQRQPETSLDARCVPRQFGIGGQVEGTDDHKQWLGPAVEEAGQGRGSDRKVAAVGGGAASEAESRAAFGDGRFCSLARSISEAGERGVETVRQHGQSLTELACG